MAIYSWYDLSWEEQRAVLRFAKRGQRHPDSKIARVADEWAKEKLGATLDGRGSAVGLMLFGGLLADGASIGEAFRDYRRARRIMRVAGSGR